MTVPLKVLRFDTFLPETTLLKETIEKRETIWSEILCHLQEVTAALKAEQGRDYAGVFRMGDFSDFAMKVARFAGIEKELEEIFSKLTQEQSMFTLEGDPIYELLCIWAKESNGSEIENKQLCRELSELALRESISFPYKDNARGFAQKMYHLRSNLAEFFEISERSIGSNRRVYSYNLKEQ